MKKYGKCAICGKELEEHGWVHERSPKNVNFFFLFKKLKRYHIKCLRDEEMMKKIKMEYVGYDL